MFGEGTLLQQLWSKAWDGDVKTQVRLGDALFAGLEVKQDFVGAARCYYWASLNGHAYAQRRFGMMLVNGEGTIRDRRSGEFWLERAAEGRDPEAPAHLSALPLVQPQRQLNEDGVAIAALKWALIADAVKVGVGVRLVERWSELLPPKLISTASESAREWMSAFLNCDDTAPHQSRTRVVVDWCRHLLERRYVAELGRLGSIYLDGDGVPQDKELGWTLLLWAAQEGNAAAQVDLGFIYTEGKGVPTDWATGMMWFHRAAEQNDFTGQSALASRYASPHNPSRDPVMGLKWALVAERCAKDPSDLHSARSRVKAMASSLSPEQIASAREMVSDDDPQGRPEPQGQD